MVEETEKPTQSIGMKKRKKMPNKRNDLKRMKGGPGAGKKVRVSQKMQKLYRKRARDYNSDDEEEDDDRASVSDGEDKEIERDGISGNSDDEAGFDEERNSDDEHEVNTGITKFEEGCKAFRMAFLNIMKKSVDDESLGPVLSAHKKLVVAKLSEEVAERKVKGEAKKEKHLMEEKGHVKPANFLDSHEKFLIGVATKGVVKLFNAVSGASTEVLPQPAMLKLVIYQTYLSVCMQVNKAQKAQKGLNPSSFKDAKVLTKRRKEAFMTELSRASTQSAETTSKASDSKGEEDGSQPAWAPLRDTFMLTNSKLKDWDKMAADEETNI
ncbi:RRP15-like protein [Bienertia sinuspersici]